jgi:hypothetical protein
MFMMTSNLFGCVLSTNETNEAVKGDFLHPQGPSQTHFSIYPDNVWIHQSTGLTKFSGRQQDEPTSLTLQQHRNTRKLLKISKVCF